LTVGFGGAVVMALPAMGGSSSALGVHADLAALISYGISLNVARPLQMRNGAYPVVWRALGVALFLTAPLGLPAVLDVHWSVRPAASRCLASRRRHPIATILTATQRAHGRHESVATAFP
jgi:drug/metabolite transporter (DMT)-like permease